MFKAIKYIFITAALALNVLFVAAQFSLSAAAVIADLGISTVTSSLMSSNADLKMKNAKTVKTVSEFSSKVAARTIKSVSVNVAAVPAEAVPFVGVGVIVATTAYEVSAACENVFDLDKMLSEIGAPLNDDTFSNQCRNVADTFEDIKNTII